MKNMKKTGFNVLGLGMALCMGFGAMTATGAMAQPEKAVPKTTDKQPETKTTTDDLPKAEDILDRYVEVTGGKAAYDAIKSMVVTGEMRMPMDMKGKMTVHLLHPNKMLFSVDLAGIGEMRSGSDGETVWSDNMMQGPRILEGAERETALESARFGDDADWRERFKEVKCTGVADVGGKQAYEIAIVEKSGSKRTAFYEKESGLLVKQKTIAETPQGTIPTETKFQDYKKVAGVLIPHKTTTTMMSMEMSMVLEKVEVNGEVPESKFELPESIKELKEKKEKKAATPAPETKAPEKK